MELDVNVAGICIRGRVYFSLLSFAVSSYCGFFSMAAQLCSSSWNLGVVWFHPVPTIQQNSCNKQILQ